jgi:hypothetical protein
MIGIEDSDQVEVKPGKGMVEVSGLSVSSLLAS